jgi:hypothetical protein
MPTECTPELFEFEGVERRAVVASFDGGTITSNAGALLLRQLDRGIGLVRRFAAPRDADRETMMESVEPVWDGNETWGASQRRPRPTCFIARPPLSRRQQ